MYSIFVFLIVMLMSSNFLVEARSQSGYSQPGYSQPGYSQPGYSQPGYSQSGYKSQSRGKSPPGAGGRSRICKDLKDYKCMRQYFSQKSTCDSDVYGRVFDTFKYMFTRTEILSLDTSFIDLSAEIINLNSCYVTEFDLIESPEVVLLTLDCKDVTISFNRTALRHRAHKLDQVFRYYITVKYPFFRMVTYFGRPNGFVSACEAFTYTEILKETSFTVKAYDKISQKFIDNDIIFKKDSRKFVDVETLSPAWGATLTNTWLNLKICNFGCNIANQYSPSGLSVRVTISESATVPKYTYY